MKTTFLTNTTLSRFAGITLLLVMLASAHTVFSQYVTILPSGITPNQSGAIPRLSYDAIMALPAPQNGDMAYDVTFSCMRLFKKNKWVKMLNDSDLVSPSVLGWQIGGAKDDVGRSLAIDASGNIYVAGTFVESALFDDDTELTATGPNTYGFFIAKYTSTGQLLWVQKAGSFQGGSSLNEMIFDTNGNIYLIGHFYGDAIFTTNTLTSAGFEDIFLAKYNSNGVFQWAQQAGGTSIDNSKDIGIDGDGNVYMTGIVKGNVSFGGTNYLGNADNDIFIAKYNSAGVLQWLRRATSDGQDTVSGLVVDSNGKVTIIGNFYDTIAFGNILLNSIGSKDFFLTQYDSTGSLLWASRYGGTGLDAGGDVALDASNNLFIAGSFSGSVAFGSMLLESAGGEDIFIAKVDNAGYISWSRRDGGTKDEKCNSMTIDAKGNIFVTGDFYSPATFGNVTLLGKNYSQLYVAKYDFKGDFQWAKEMGGYANEVCYKIVADTKGNAYITGGFNYSFNVDDISFTTRGQYDAFVTRFRD